MVVLCSVKINYSLQLFFGVYCFYDFVTKSAQINKNLKEEKKNLTLTQTVWPLDSKRPICIVL